MLEIRPYGRFWSVTENGELLCVAVYKKGANAVKARIEQLTRTVALRSTRQRMKKGGVHGRCGSGPA